MSKIIQKHPIVAISTPIGEGGISIIRVSGKDAIKIVNRIFKGKDLNQCSSHTIHYGAIHQNDQIIDKVLVSLFKSPNSYTGEETVEISCHGGMVVTQEIVNLCLHVGMRYAQPGEFTQRAFLNGKMDLVQVEAVADIIHAKNKKAVHSAQSQLEGVLGKQIKLFRTQLVEYMALLELELDFSDEDVEFANRQQMNQLLSHLCHEIQNLLNTYDMGKMIVEGVKAVIIGQPNVGKSTLFNALLGRDRSIVTAVEGTTRDTIEEYWTYDGLLFHIIDTAGIRDTKDIVEKEGVNRSYKALKKADIILYLIDVSKPVNIQIKQHYDTIKQKLNKPMICIGNKVDLGICDLDSFETDINISAKENYNFTELKKIIKNAAIPQTDVLSDGIMITNMRHQGALKKALEFLKSAQEQLKQGVSNEFLAIDMRGAIMELGKIIGDITSDEILGNIFSRFCIGK